MKSKKVKSGKLDKNVRNTVKTCAECGCMLKFSIKDEVVVKGDGVIAVNFPCAVCHDCVHSIVDRVTDPSGLICVNELSPILAGEIIMNFDFLLSPSHAVDFFISLFPENDLVNAACEQRLHGEKK